MVVKVGSLGDGQRGQSFPCFIDEVPAISSDIFVFTLSIHFRSIFFNLTISCYKLYTSTKQRCRTPKHSTGYML